MTRWRQFSLRTFLLLVTLLSMGLAWIAAERSQTARANAAVAYLMEREAFVFEAGDNSPLRKGLWKLILGDNAGTRRCSVHLSGSKTVDDDLTQLRDLPNLESLHIGENTTDRGLMHLRDHPQISTVFIKDSKVTDEGLIHLRTLPRLKRIYLYQTPITGAGFVHLQGLSLEHLDICQSPLRDENLRHLRLLKHIEKLELGDTPITDAGLRHLHEIKSLREVNVTLCPVTPAGVDALLEAIPELTVLDRFRPRGTRVITY